MVNKHLAKHIAVLWSPASHKIYKALLSIKMQFYSTFCISSKIIAKIYAKISKFSLFSIKMQFYSTICINSPEVRT